MCSVYYQPNSSRRGGPLSRPPAGCGPSESGPQPPLAIQSVCKVSEKLLCVEIGTDVHTDKIKPCPHNEARPHLQLCDRGVDGQAGEDGPPASGEGGMLPEYQLQGEFVISVPRHRSSAQYSVFSNCSSTVTVSPSVFSIQ